MPDFLPDLAVHAVVLLCLAAFVAGFIDSIAGGGGLITVPALLLAGLPPVEALATNKLLGLFGTGSATLHYASRGLVDIRAQLPLAALAGAGGLAGALLAMVVPASVLSAALPVLLIAIALYFALRRNLGDTDRTARLPPLMVGLAVVPAVGLYDGLFGPGAGSFYMLAFVALAGLGVLKATAQTKLLNFASNLGGFLTFAYAGVVWWSIGLMMGAAGFLGARLGAALAVRIGARLIRPLLVIVCLALAARLLADPAQPLRHFLGF